MPIPGTHTARQMDPDSCDRIRTEHIGAGVTFNYCVKAAGGPVEVQSVHFDAAKFTPEQAREWLKKHDFSADKFEEAAPVKANAAAKSNLACQMMDVANCPMGEKCPMRQQSADTTTTPAYAESAGLEIRASATGTCEIEAQAAGSNGATRVNLLGYTGVPMKLEGFHLPVVVDLESLKVPRQKVPILRDHDSGRIAGHSESIEVNAQQLKASGVLSGIPQHTEDIVHTASKGFPWQVSIGAQTTRKVEHIPAGETAKVNGRDWNGPLLVARGAVLRELSLLPMGADGNTDAAFSATAVTDIA